MTELKLVENTTTGLTITQYHPDHARELHSPEEFAKIEKFANLYTNFPHSYTFHYDDKIILCCGIADFWEGVGELWMMACDDFESYYSYSALALIKDSIDKLVTMEGGYHRLQGTCLASCPVRTRFFEWLDFKKEGTLHDYDHRARDFYMYARTR